MNPKVTVLMPVYNASAHLREAIDSILKQTYTGFELLIINDGSIDDSHEIISSYTDSRITYVINEVNLKLIATLNKGIELAKGEYIVRMDADDISLPNRIQALVGLMDSTPEVAVCGSWYEIFGGKNKLTKYETQDDDIKVRMLHQCHMCHPAVVMRKSVLMKHNLRYNTGFIHAEDYELWVQISKHAQLANVPEVLLKYRVHENSVSAKYADVQLQNTARINKIAFKQLGVDVTDEEIKLYHKLAYADFTCTDTQLAVLQGLIDKMMEANTRTNYVQQRVLGHYLAQKWAAMVFNAPVRGSVMRKLYFCASLNAYMPAGPLEKLRVIVKSIVK